MRFVDTDVLLYAASRDPADQAKRELASQILDATDLAFSAQVLQDFYVQATRPTRVVSRGHALAVELIESLLEFPVTAITPEIVLAAISTSDRFRISYWDAAILEAARAVGCEVVLTEDLTDGQDFAGVRVENPFRR